jgi:hypothetical protein
MQPIDRPFRFTLDFVVVWALLAVPSFFLLRQADLGPWYSQVAAFVLLPLFATFVLYGPVLLARLIIRSGTRGWFVARVLVSILLAAGVYAAILFFTGHADSPSWRTGVVSCMAVTYLHWRLRNEPSA